MKKYRPARLRSISELKRSQTGTDKPVSARTLEFRLSDYIKAIILLILLLWLIWLTIKVNSPAGIDQKYPDKDTEKLEPIVSLRSFRNNDTEASVSIPSFRSGDFDALNPKPLF